MNERSSYHTWNRHHNRRKHPNTFYTYLHFNHCNAPDDDANNSNHEISMWISNRNVFLWRSVKSLLCQLDSPHQVAFLFELPRVCWCVKPSSCTCTTVRVVRFDRVDLSRFPLSVHCTCAFNLFTFYAVCNRGKLSISCHFTNESLSIRCTSVYNDAHLPCKYKTTSWIKCRLPLWHAMCTHVWNILKKEKKTLIKRTITNLRTILCFCWWQSKMVCSFRS